MNQETERKLIRRRLLGIGLACQPIAGGVDIGRDIVLVASGTPAVRDLALVEGMDNLGQSLAIALTTPLTGDVFNVDFGFDGLRAMAEETTPIMVQERVRVGVITLLKKDPRVRRIVDVRLQDGRLVDPGANTRQLDVRVVFETITADTTTLDLGKVLANA
jgi:phage baseplate assembly protein W